jgi:hypothetical protein
MFVDRNSDKSSLLNDEREKIPSIFAILPKRYVPSTSVYSRKIFILAVHVLPIRESPPVYLFPSFFEDLLANVLS